MALILSSAALTLASETTRSGRRDRARITSETRGVSRSSSTEPAKFSAIRIGTEGYSPMEFIRSTKASRSAPRAFSKLNWASASCWFVLKKFRLGGKAVFRASLNRGVNRLGCLRCGVGDLH